MVEVNLQFLSHNGLAHLILLGRIISPTNKGKKHINKTVQYYSAEASWDID